MAWLESGGSALLGAVVGAFGSYLVQRRLGRLDQKRQLVITHIQELQSDLHTTTFMIRELVEATRTGTPERVRLVGYEIIERASATQMPKTILAAWHREPASAVTAWEERILAFAMGTIEALDSGDSSSEMRRAYEHTQGRREDDDFGLERAVNRLTAALTTELGKEFSY